MSKHQRRQQLAVQVLDRFTSAPETGSNIPSRPASARPNSARSRQPTVHQPQFEPPAAREGPQSQLKYRNLAGSVDDNFSPLMDTVDDSDKAAASVNRSSPAKQHSRPGSGGSRVAENRIGVSGARAVDISADGRNGDSKTAQPGL
jgi:hypothetical protein